MTPRLSKELSDALKASGAEELEAVDPATGRVYVVVDRTLLRRLGQKRHTRQSNGGSTAWKLVVEFHWKKLMLS